MVRPVNPGAVSAAPPGRGVGLAAAPGVDTPATLPRPFGAESRQRPPAQTTKVVQIAIDKYAHGWFAEEIKAQRPHPSLAQVHAALSYYYDHQAEMDAEMERMTREDEALRAQAGVSRVEQRLRQRKW